MLAMAVAGALLRSDGSLVFENCLRSAGEASTALLNVLIEARGEDIPVAPATLHHPKKSPMHKRVTADMTALCAFATGTCVVRLEFLAADRIEIVWLFGSRWRFSLAALWCLRSRGPKNVFSNAAEWENLHQNTSVFLPRVFAFAYAITVLGEECSLLVMEALPQTLDGVLTLFRTRRCARAEYMFLEHCIREVLMQMI